MKSRFPAACLSAFVLLFLERPSVHALSVRIFGEVPGVSASTEVINDGDVLDLNPAAGSISFNLADAAMGYSVSGTIHETPGSIDLGVGPGLTLTDFTVSGTAPRDARGLIGFETSVPAFGSGLLFANTHLSGTYTGVDPVTDIKRFTAAAFTPVGWQLTGNLNPPPASDGAEILENSSSPNFETPVSGIRGELEFTMVNGQGFDLPSSASISFNGANVAPVPDSTSFAVTALLLSSLVCWHGRTRGRRKK